MSRSLVAQRALAVVLLMALLACGNPPSAAEQIGTEQIATEQTAATVLNWKLPKELREVSGLALTDTATGKSAGINTVYAVADERAHIFELDYHSGTVLSVFSLGQPARKGDYEGIATADGWLYLVTSDGVLLRSRGAADGAIAAYDTFDLGTRDDCEIEALASAPPNSQASKASNQSILWLACKKIFGKAHTTLRLYSVLMTDTGPTRLTALELPLDDALTELNSKRFAASGIAFVPVPRGYELLVIAAAQHAYGRWHWSAAPQFLAAAKLPGGHRQAEGVDIGPAGEILLADEGGKKRARLRVYPAGTLY